MLASEQSASNAHIRRVQACCEWHSRRAGFKMLSAPHQESKQALGCAAWRDTARVHGTSIDEMQSISVYAGAAYNATVRQGMLTHGESKQLHVHWALVHFRLLGSCSVCLCLQRQRKTHDPSCTMKKYFLHGHFWHLHRLMCVLRFVCIRPHVAHSLVHPRNAKVASVLQRTPRKLRLASVRCQSCKSGHVGQIWQ